MGAASRVWLHHALLSLNESLQGGLHVFSGDPLQIIEGLVEKHSVQHVYWNRCYEPWQIARDQVIKSTLRARGVGVQSTNGSLLWEPWSITKKDNTPYRVFTPYYRNGCLQASPPRQPVPPPALELVVHDKEATTIEELSLLPDHNWASETIKGWQVGESAAHTKLEHFLSQRIGRYKTGRDFPSANAVSTLSPHLHFGEVSPNQLWYASTEVESTDNVEHFRRELAWREFSYSLLYYFPTLPTQNLQSKFDAFPWRHDTDTLRRWQTGQTGYPLVDAGMRELWQTGYMHNRIRMVVGSFLVKNLLLHWHHGEAWFWDCLFDADLASNSASWQWIAGCGADAAPYFRVFNPSTQGQKFDPTGEYTRRFVPELARLSDKYLYQPWDAPASVLADADIRLGVDYPHPIVDLKASRLRALEAYQIIKQPHI